MGMSVADIVQWLEALAPSYLAAEWDNVGLQVGYAEAPAERILTCLSVDHSVLDQALALGTQLIVAHHPLIFRPWHHVRADCAGTSVAVRLVQAGVSLCVLHTNLDAAPDGLGQWAAQAVGIHGGQPLIPCLEDRLQKLVVFVPVGHVAAVRTAISEAGAGRIGNYSHCTFACEGQGTFLPLAGSRPYLGREGELEEVREVRLETILPAALSDRVLAAMRAAHPYEEVAYDLYNMAIAPRAGYGRVGSLATPLSFPAFLDHLKQRLGTERLLLAGPAPARVARVAVVNGSGAEYLEHAHRAGVDVYVTGDLRYHDAHRAAALGLCVVDAGHFATESMAAPRLAAYLQGRVRAVAASCEVVVAEETDAMLLPGQRMGGTS